MKVVILCGGQGTRLRESAGVEIGFVLEEVEVAPSQDFRIVGLGVVGAEGGQGKVEPRGKSR